MVIRPAGNVYGVLSDYPDIFGIDLHTHGKETFQFDKQTLDLGAAGGHQAALVSVERAADDADLRPYMAGVTSSGR